MNVGLQALQSNKRYYKCELYLKITIADSLHHKERSLKILILANTINGLRYQPHFNIAQSGQGLPHDFARNKILLIQINKSAQLIDVNISESE